MQPTGPKKEDGLAAAHLHEGKEEEKNGLPVLCPVYLCPVKSRLSPAKDIVRTQMFPTEKKKFLRISKFYPKKLVGSISF